MTDEQGMSESELIVECNSGLDVSMVTDFKSILKQAIAQELPVVMDVSNLERIDGAALQLLAAFCLEAKDAGLAVSWRSPSDELCYAAEITGLTNALDL